MTCDDVERLAGAYHDGELDAALSSDLESHVATCQGCAARLAALQALSVSLRAAPYYRAPAALTRSVTQRLAPPVLTRRPRLSIALPWLIAAVSVVVVAAMTLPLRFGRSGSDAVVNEVMASHLRSLQADHLVDVASSDRHTVKPWFAGRLDFSPTVVDLAADGFPLVGGRLDFVDGRSVAALVYRRRQHDINVLAWPATTPQESVAHRDDPRGYHLIHWTRDHMTWWVVSDLASVELNDFADRLMAATAKGS